MIAIVTDSSAGYSVKELEDRNITLINLSYVVEGKSYDEYANGENGNFMESVTKSDCKTSQPSIGRFAELFQSLCSKGYSVLAILLSSNLSGTYFSAALAAKQAEGDVRVFDSATTAAGLRLIVDEAVNMVVGNMSLNSIVEHLEEIKNKVNTVFTVECLEPLRKGGRLAVKQGTNTNLNLRPILGCKSSIRFIQNVRGAKARNEELIKAVPLDARRIFVMKVGKDTFVEDLIDGLKQKFPKHKIHCRTVGPVLSVHLGAGTYGVAFI